MLRLINAALQSVAFWGPSVQVHASPPEELFSPLIGPKILAKASNDLCSAFRYPQWTNKHGIWQLFPADQWTPSFIHSVDWLSLGREWSQPILPLVEVNNLQADFGFVSFPFRDELQINPNDDAARNLIRSFADQWARRVNPLVGCARSFDTVNPTIFQVAIDNMMNLDLLFLAADITGNNTYREIAIRHADKTIEEHIRPDGSSFHQVKYNSTTGNVIGKESHQGYAANSTWTRGHAWGILGFATMYKHTGLQRYLEASRQLATFFINSIPADGIVPWDFNAPIGPIPHMADSAAAYIAATGLLLLSQLEDGQNPRNATGSAFWRDSAIALVKNMTALAWRPEWQSLLANGTVNANAIPPNVLSGSILGDYYFVKVGNDLVSMGLAHC